MTGDLSGAQALWPMAYASLIRSLLSRGSCAGATVLAIQDCANHEGHT